MAKVFELFVNLSQDQQDEIVNYLGSLQFTDNTIKRALIETDAIASKSSRGYVITAKSFFDFAEYLKERYLQQSAKKVG